MTSPLKGTADVSSPTALLLAAFHRAYALPGLTADPVSWHHCDTISSCSWTAVTIVRVPRAVCR